MPSPTLKGVATIIWGAYNSMAAPAGAVIQSGKITPKNGAPIEIEDTNGFAITEVVLKDGFNARFELLYDSNLAWPVAGANCVVNLPSVGYSSNGSANANMIAYTCLVGSEPEIDLARKREGMITYNLTYRPGVTV